MFKNKENKNNEKKEIVKDQYSKMIKGKEEIGCCTVDNKNQIPSFGVGNPLKYVDLNSGDYLIDIGSGPGKNCLKAAKIIGEKGKVIGLDLTEEMVNSAKKEAMKEDLKWIDFIQGDAEDIPFADNYFDVAISDCVINLVPDKKKVFSEIFRVLKKGGQIMISDVVSDKKFPSKLKEDNELWCGCVSGAIPEKEFLNIIKETGFEDLQIVEKKENQRKINNINISYITVKAKKT